MQIAITASKISGIICAPASKSVMQRACAAALLHEGKSRIYNPGRSEDDVAAMAIIQILGAQLKDHDSFIEIESEGLKSIQGTNSGQIECGESGLSARMFTPIAALSHHFLEINARGSLLKRPMHFFEDYLPALGVDLASSDGKLPFRIRGPLQGKHIKVDGRQSSQYITGLVMAYSAIVKGGEIIEIDDLKSKPYLDLTLQVMAHFGLAIPENHDYQQLIFAKPLSERSIEAITFTVEGDWSNAAFWLVAGVIHDGLIIKGLDLNSCQADAVILRLMQHLNIKMELGDEAIKVHPTAYAAFVFDATDCPDLFPPLVVLAAFAQGVSEIKGLKRLASKESDRGKSLYHEFEKMGLNIVLKEDSMFVHGNAQLLGTTVSSCNDHRMAMALAIAATKARGTTIINDAEAVRKSYPKFFDELSSLGAQVAIVSQ